MPYTALRLVFVQLLGPSIPRKVPDSSFLQLSPRLRHAGEKTPIPRSGQCVPSTGTEASSAVRRRRGRCRSDQDFNVWVNHGRANIRGDQGKAVGTLSRLGRRDRFVYGGVAHGPRAR